MRTFGKVLGRILLTLVIIIGLLYFFGPREKVDTIISFNHNSIGNNINLYLEEQESAYSDITPGTERRIIWHGTKGIQTPVSVVVMHGFSASSEEIRPVPDLVANELGANIYFMRFKGHGRDGVALSKANAGDWLEDTAEAMEIGRRIGEKVIVIGTSMGGTIATILAASTDLNRDVAGYVMVSPLYGVNNLAAPLLSLPLARYWIPLVAGEIRSFKPDNEGHGKYWTTSYPTVSTLPMQAAIDYAVSLSLNEVRTPALFIYSENDQVVDVDKIENVIENWGGNTTIEKRVMTSLDDPQSHVIAGAIRSPSQTQEISDLIVEWAEEL
jgi:esterase/lipase